MHRSPTQDPRYFVENMCTIIDGNAPSRENVLLLGDFSMEANDKGNLINTYNFLALLKDLHVSRLPKGDPLISCSLIKNIHS